MADKEINPIVDYYVIYRADGRYLDTAFKFSEAEEKAHLFASTLHCSIEVHAILANLHFVHRS